MLPRAAVKLTMDVGIVKLMPFTPPIPSVIRTFQQIQRNRAVAVQRLQRDRVAPLLGGTEKRVRGRIGVLACYPYKLDPAYREKLRSVEEQAAVTFVFPEDDPSPAHLDDKLLSLLSGVGYAIFDWTEWNANVAFEFGIAIALVSTMPSYPPGLTPRLRRANLAIYVRSGFDREVPSDLGGMGRNRYSDLADLERQLTQNLSNRFPLVK